MLIIRRKPDLAEILPQLADWTIRHLIETRLTQLTEDGFDPFDLGPFVIVQPGDTIPALNAEIGFPIDRNFLDGVTYGDPDFTPSWEWCLDHGGWFEAVFILSDDGCGFVLFIPDREDVDARLLAMCREHTTERSTPNAP